MQALQPILTQQRQPLEAQSFSIKPYGKVIDTSTKQGSELYGQAIKTFDPLYDGSQEHLHTYIDKIRQRSGHLNCIKIFDITSHNELRKNIFEDYNSLTLEEIRQAAIIRWSVNNWNKQSSYIMGIAMLDSLDQNFRSRVVDHSEKYTISENNVQCVDAPTL